jgi:GNAT superfamily N-acetyltransferase
MGSMVVVREVSPDDWEILRDVRLAALREAPQAFASTYAREALAGVYLADDGIPDLVSMWVRPPARGQRVGEALITAAADWVKAHDHDAVFLWVTASNAAAQKLYQRCGFAPTGDRQPLPSDPELTEIRMRRPL